MAVDSCVMERLGVALALCFGHMRLHGWLRYGHCAAGVGSPQLDGDSHGARHWIDGQSFACLTTVRGEGFIDVTVTPRLEGLSASRDRPH